MCPMRLMMTVTRTGGYISSEAPHIIVQTLVTAQACTRILERACSHHQAGESVRDQDRGQRTRSCRLALLTCLELPPPVSARRHDVGVDPEEQVLGELVRSERHQQRRGRRTLHCSRRRRFLRRLSDRTVRSKLVGCLLSAVVLTIILSIYLSLALQNRHLGQHFHVIFILIILLITIIFCHSLVRLCMLALLAPPPVEKRRRRHRAAVADPVHHADPESLAHVLPDSVETETDELRLPPPAYGRWRGSVRIDPIYFLHMPPSHAFDDANAEPSHGHHATPRLSVSSPLSPPSPSRYSASSGYPTRPPSYTSEKPSSEGGDIFLSSPSPAPPLPQTSRHRPTLASFFFRSARASPEPRR
ncbi:MAG: hypothetical protein M1815_001787 [Lichina confinis]|nr:MAG: hypothetical protein M1815_001787 [Lichina confinis]